jgi:hypothetical protein
MNEFVLPSYENIEFPTNPSTFAVWDDIDPPAVEIREIPIVPNTPGGDCNGLPGASQGLICNITEPNEFGLWNIVIFDGINTQKVEYSGWHETFAMTGSRTSTEKIERLPMPSECPPGSRLVSAIFGVECPDTIFCGYNVIRASVECDWYAYYNGEETLVERREQTEKWLDCCAYTDFPVIPDYEGGVNKIYGSKTLSAFTYAVFTYQSVTLAGIFGILGVSIPFIFTGFPGGGVIGTNKKKQILSPLKGNALITIRPNIKEK